MRRDLIKLGSHELYNQIIEDINELINSAFHYNYIPIQIGLGRVFIEMSCCQSVIYDFDIESWDDACKTKDDALQEVVNTRYIEAIKSLEKNDGLIKDQNMIEFYYDPDEPYITLYAISLEDQAEEGEKKTNQGLAIRAFRYKNEVFNPDKIH